MNISRMPVFAIIVVSVIIFGGRPPIAVTEDAAPDNLLKNGSFELHFNERGIPDRWRLYGAMDAGRSITGVSGGYDGDNALLITDGDRQNEIGISQTIEAKGNECYEASVWVRRERKATPTGSYLQLRFLPSNKLFQRPLRCGADRRFTRISVKGVAPKDTTHARIYLYTHRTPTPKVVIDTVSVIAGVQPPPAPPPEPVPPQYDNLKGLHLRTHLVDGGEPNCAIIAPASGKYDAVAHRIQGHIRQLSAVTVPIETDDEPIADIPLTSNLIIPGNRCTNRAIERLYNRFYCMVDLKYPGNGGHVLRTLHNPFGGGHNVVFISGSDDAGVGRAADVFVEKLATADHKNGVLSIGRIADIELGDHLQVTRDVRELNIWDASKGYGSTGYFGWCSISKHLAAFYMTGDRFHAREFLRLAFPDDEAKEQIAEIDGERIENKDDPLAGFYHYNAHIAVLLWDLVEESPVFTDAERLKVTNAFARQLNHRAGEGIYRLTHPPAHVGSRHAQWSAISLYCLGRYFNKDYPNRIWAQCMRGPKMHFAPLAEHAWVSGESDNLYWYNTATAPILTWMLLSGDRKAIESGSLQKLLRSQEILISGRRPDWALRSASVTYLNKAAYLTDDGRWLTYRKRTGVDTDVFRLGQSYWPDDTMRPQPPDDLIDRWSINYLPEPARLARDTGFRHDQSFYFASYRTDTDDTGEFALMDGFNGASRNPYHNLAILQLRIAGHTVLRGYRNQVLTRSGGLMEDQVAMNARLQSAHVIGDTASFIADVPKSAYCNWQRSLLLRKHRYALVIDQFDIDPDADDLEVQRMWDTKHCKWDPANNSLIVRPEFASNVPRGWKSVRALDCEYHTNIAGPRGVAPLHNLNIVLLRATKIGQWLELKFSVDEGITGTVFARLLKYKDRGKARIALDGQTMVSEYDAFDDSVVEDRVPLGKHTLAAGEHTLRLTVTGKHGDLEKAYLGIRGLLVKPPEAAEAAPINRCRILPAEALNNVQTTGGTAKMNLRLHGKAGQQSSMFSLIAFEREGAQMPACNRIADNCAALVLPQAALAVTGEYENISADISILATDHLYGHNLLRAGIQEDLVRADNPIDIDWDFDTGEIAIIADQPISVQLHVAAGAELRMDDRPAETARTDAELLAIDVPSGTHKIANAPPAENALAGLREALEKRLQQGTSGRQPQQVTESIGVQQAAAPKAILEREVGGNVADLITVPSDDGPLVCAAAENRIHLITADNKQLRVLKTDGDIRTLHYWPEHELLLAGCKDEKLIAFSPDGDRRWEFVSKMDPAVYEAAKTYWFKSAGPAHAGVHAVTTGEFLNGNTQAFVGSACTLEILDHRGNLIKRMPIFWGPGHKFALVDAPDGSINLLIAREPTDGERLAIVNNRELKRTGSGFHTVPPGHTYIGSWAGMSRDHIFYEDMNADGAKEIVSEINGVWNRVTMWNIEGKALHSVNFGPGRRIPARNMRDMDIADFGADGDREIIAATSSGIVVALDNTCSKLWSQQLPNAPTVLKCIRGPEHDDVAIFVGCEDGSIIVLDDGGEVIRSGTAPGKPACITETQYPDAGTRVVIGTTNGHIAAITL